MDEPLNEENPYRAPATVELIETVEPIDTGDGKDRATRYLRRYILVHLAVLCFFILLGDFGLFALFGIGINDTPVLFLLIGSVLVVSGIFGPVAAIVDASLLFSGITGERKYLVAGLIDTVITAGHMLALWISVC